MSSSSRRMCSGILPDCECRNRLSCQALNDAPGEESIESPPAPQEFFFSLHFSYMSNSNEEFKYKVFSGTIPVVNSDMKIALAIAAVTVPSSNVKVEASR